VKILRVGENFASCCTLQVSEAALVKTEGLADEALRLCLPKIGSGLHPIFWERHDHTHNASQSMPWDI
jgi:hypothetical protein